MEINVDYANAAAWNEAEMRERSAWLRSHAPVYWSEKTNAWIISSFEHVSFVSKHQELFTSANGVRPGRNVKIGLIDEGEPRHGALRKLINRGFTPRMVKVLEDKFRIITTETLDAIARQGECDFVEDIAVPLPLLMIAEMIGIRKEDRQRFHQWSDAMIAADGNYDDPEVTARAGQAFVEYSAYVSEIIEERRQNLQDDLVSILVGAHDDGMLGTDEYQREELLGLESQEPLDLANAELIKLLVILMVAGNETTRNAISGGMQYLIENPSARQKLIDDPSLIPAAAEEIVRIVSPVLSFSRTVTQDCELGGHAISRGQEVLLMYPSANWDENEFESAHEFRVERNPQHVGFGVGTHFCLGANLARMELRVAFEELLRRFPDMRYSTDGPSFRPSALVRSCVEMRVAYTPEA